MADPLWTELKGSAGFAALYQELMVASAFPERSIKAIRHRPRERHAGGHIRGGCGIVGHIVLRVRFVLRQAQRERMIFDNAKASPVRPKLVEG